MVWIFSALNNMFMCVIFKLFYISLCEIYFNKINIKTKCLENKCTTRDMLTKYATNVTAYLESSIYAAQPPQLGHCDLRMKLG